MNLLFVQPVSPLRWCHVLPNPFTKLKLTIVACYTYFADLFAQGLDLSGRTRILHNVLVGVPAAMQSDGSFRHAYVIAKIATNSMQIFALSQLPGYLPPANTAANVGVHNSEGIPVICRQEIRITIATPVMPLDAVTIVDSHEMTSQRLVRKLTVWSHGRVRFLASQWADHRLGDWESCPYSHLTSRSGNFSVLSNGDTKTRCLPEPPEVDGVSGVDGILDLAPRLERHGVRGLLEVVGFLFCGDGVEAFIVG
ncbi:conserved hypothetical protein [Trichinella spiralis]|uniref:hypothetical protein n=2 Tax=Trichinella spiralis TaxID=6334 RepID=UPI0001EFD301|nr:conserved hypothetical protein [Trichinella spiralis]